ncbi:hypothetical protein XENTR_v10006149 [Xenopus tropicalis]|nr:hypothetical protein XENTR_v10006149 [Xenopus tropicalis]
MWELWRKKLQMLNLLWRKHKAYLRFTERFDWTPIFSTFLLNFLTLPVL